MGLFDKKPKKKDSFLGGNYEPDAWRKHIPYNARTTHTSGTGAQKTRMATAIATAAWATATCGMTENGTTLQENFKYCTTLWKATSITQPTGNLNSRNVNEHQSENTHE